MRTASVLFASSLLFSANVFAQDAAAPMPAATASESLGLSAGLKIAYSSPSSIYDSEGESTEFPDEFSSSFMIINLGVGYEVAQVPGLFAGLDLPIVRSAVSVGDVSNSSMGIGDLSLFAGYLHPVVPDTLKLGGKLRYKQATGASELDELDEDQLPTGSGFNNVQVGVLAEADVQGVGINAELGYLMQLAHTEDGGTVDPSDFMYADIGVGYAVHEMVTPELHILYAAGSNVKQGPEGDLQEVEDTGPSWIALALDVNIKVNDMLTAFVGLGTPLDMQGLNLPYGFVVSGKNTFGGATALNLGAKATF